ncbi:hypothetical protein [Sorangium cellulosum]|nr:hypothetical protein [Sorangium cellulosum]
MINHVLAMKKRDVCMRRSLVMLALTVKPRTAAMQAEPAALWDVLERK